jgi:hypothetical protein
VTAAVLMTRIEATAELPGAKEIGNCDGRDDQDNGNDEQQFNQREPVPVSHKFF